MMKILALLLPISLSLANGQLYDNLFRQLMSRYNKDTLPFNSLTDVVDVNVTFILLELTSLDANTGDASMEAWMGYTWTDRRLRWNVADYNRIEQLNMPQKYIWKPDIVLYNGRVNIDDDLLVVVTSQGAVSMYPRLTIQTRCDLTNISINNTAMCNLKFGSWAYDGSKISPALKEKGLDMSNYRLSMDWEIVNAEAHRNVKKYVCCPETYPSMDFNLTFKQQIQNRTEQIRGTAMRSSSCRLSIDVPVLPLVMFYSWAFI